MKGGCFLITNFVNVKFYEIFLSLSGAQAEGSAQHLVCSYGSDACVSQGF